MRLACTPLALLAWFLITAPYVGPATDRRVDTKAELSEWHILAPYDSLSTCEHKRLVLIGATKGIPDPQNTFRCVPTDDPRIKLGGPLPNRGESSSN